MFLIFLIILLIILISLFYFKNYHNAIKLSRKFNGPPAYPIIGNGLILFNKNSNEILEILFKLCRDREYNKICRLWLGPDLNLFVADPKFCEKVLSSQKLIDKSSEYTFLNKWLGDGLLLSTGSKWQKRRKIITPTFHFSILEQFIEIFNREGDVLVDKMKRFKINESFDIYPLITLYALDVICETAMGTSANAQLDENSKYVQAVKDIAEVLHLRMFNFLIRNKYTFLFSKASRIEEKALKVLHEFTDKVIVQRRDELISNSKDLNVDVDGIGIKRKMAFLDVLLQSNIDGKPLTNMDIREEVDTFMFEGHDTTTSGISFGIFNLARYPDIQKKLYNEITEVLGEDISKPVTIADLNKLRYLDLFIKENLRLYPSVPMIGRKTSKDTEINGKIVPGGTNIVLFVYCMNRDPELFPEPEKFILERFDVEHSAEKLNPYAYVPFSAGPRNCIGQKFAILEMKSILVKLLRNFEFNLPNGENAEPKLKAPLILKACDGLMVNIKPRRK